MDPQKIVPFETPKPSSRFTGTPMRNDLVEAAAEIVPDPQILVNLISKRVRQLNSGRAPLIDVVPSMGFADIALTELIEGKIKWVETCPDID